MTTERNSETLSPLVELTLARLREFIRDPSAVFWTFGFPIVLAVALGIAFREAPPPSSHVAIDTAAPGATELALALDADEAIVATTMAESLAARSLATGKIDLFVVPTADGPVTYRYDAVRPESSTARLAVDAAIQRRAGRVDVVASTDDVRTEPGGRYIDFLLPGLIGLNIMGSAIWGIGFAIVDARRRKMLKRLAATPMSRAHFLLSFMMSRLALKEALGASAARELDPERSRRTAQGRLSDGLRGGQQPNLERSPSERLYPTCARQSRQPWHVGALRRAALAAA